jgi:hypothetical protein
MRMALGVRLPFSAPTRTNQILHNLWQVFGAAPIEFGGQAFIPEELSLTDDEDERSAS